LDGYEKLVINAVSDVRREAYLVVPKDTIKRYIGLLNRTFNSHPRPRRNFSIGSLMDSSQQFLPMTLPEDPSMKKLF
jgi:hypothetical protein